MAYKKRHIEGLTSAAPTILGTLGLGATYARPVSMKARLWSSSAKSVAGADTAIRVELKDADGNIFYLDAADVDYATSAKNYVFSKDDTTTGITGHTYVDQTGATLAGVSNTYAPLPPVKGPLTVTIRNCGTATDYVELDVIVDTGN